MSEIVERHVSRTFIKFLIPSLLGIFFFLMPIEYNGELTIMMGVIVSKLNVLSGEYIVYIALTLLGISAIVTPFVSWVYPKCVVNRPSLAHLFKIAPIWVILRISGFILGLLIVNETGPEFIWGTATGHVVFYDLVLGIISLFLVAIFLLPLLTDFGAMELIGTLAAGLFRRLFTLPGRAAVDATASWLSAAAVGLLITNQQYKSGYYSAREACVIATNFSIVSLPFCLLIITVVGLPGYFIPYYLTISLVGVITAMILPRIPPLSHIQDKYIGNHSIVEAQQGEGIFSHAFKAAILRAEHAPNVREYMKSASVNLLDIWFGLLPSVLTVGLIGLCLVEYTSLFTYLSMPLVPVLELLQIPEAAAAAPALLVGFAEMFLPAVMAKGIESELTRFVIAGVSVTQLIYMSEVGILLLKSEIPLSFVMLVKIFILRTLIALPLIALAAHLLF